MMTLVLFLLFANDCPMHEQHMMEARHDTFGFSHEATTHTFRSLDDGGAIELRANDAANAPAIAAIRAHLTEVAKAFGKNDFSMPHFVHDKTPDGVAEMQKLHAAITYRYEELPEGGRVKMTATDAAALKAVHAFIAFQVKEHTDKR